MAKFKCDDCLKEINLTKYSIKIVDGKTVYPEAYCCYEYMNRVKTLKPSGFGGIIKKPGGKIGGKF